MGLSPGTRLGHYEILHVIGEGGMGEVYRARDLRLNRDVAIKILSGLVALVPGSIARFEQEAITVAKLSHPNILAIHEFGRENGTVFVAMELVDGETLRARLAAGPLPARRAVAYAFQLARGIAAAHSRGIVHRDLKPENVMITREDQVKILDFGLAKTMDVSETEMTRGRGVTTNVGTILGSSGYMAPEQVRGLSIDHRTDIFALGAVLYEMLSGQRAFMGQTKADTMSAILTGEPPELDAPRLSISPGLERIVRRCLEKSPDLRFQSANDLAFALETLSTVSTASAVTADMTGPARRSTTVWLPWTVAAIGLLAASASWMLAARREKPQPPWDSFMRISESAGEETSPSLSPDGNTIAYAVRVNGSWGIYAQRVGGRNALPIVDDPQRDERAPAFSPDGSLIAFHESDELGGIFVAGATGESVRRVTDIGFDPAWSPDGRKIAFTTEEIIDPSSRLGDSTLFVVDITGGTPRKVVDGDAVQAAWSPAGDRIVYWSNSGGQRDIYTVAATGGTRVPVTQDRALDWCPVWSPDGRFIYFSSDRGGAMNLWRIAVDQASGRPAGVPESVTTGVQASAELPRFSKDGSRLAFRSRVASINPVVLPFDPVTERAGTPTLLDTQNNIRVPSGVSPDGKQIAYFSVGERQEDVFIGPRDGPMRRITDDSWRDRAPVFTPDGSALVFYSNRDGNWGVWRIGIDGGNLRKIAGPPTGAVYALVSPKGDTVVFEANSGRAMFSAPISSTSEPTELPGAVVDDKYFNPTGWSPDGARLAGVLQSTSGRPSGVAVYDLVAHTTTMISADETYAAKWLADGRRVVYFTKSGSELIVLDTVTRTRTVVNVHLPGPSARDVFAISPDNRTIYYGAVRAESDIWMAERR